MTRPLISVMVITWNHAPYIAQCLQSLVDQDYRPIEIVFLDNHSTDGTFEIGLELLTRSGVSFKAIQNESPAGISANLNKLFAHCSGAMISSVSGDDWWAPNNLSEKMKVIEAHPEYGMVYGTGWVYYEDLDQYQDIGTEGYKAGQLFDQLLMGNFIFAHGWVVRREVIESVSGWDESSPVDDWDMWLRIAKDYAIGYSDVPSVYYRKHSSNYSSKRKEILHGQLKIVDKYSSHPSYAKAQQSAYRSYALWSLCDKPKRSAWDDFRTYISLLTHAEGQRGLSILFKGKLYRLLGKNRA